MVENEPTVGRSLAFSILFFVVLKMKVAFVLFYRSNPPNIKMLVDEI